MEWNLPQSWIYLNYGNLTKASLEKVLVVFSTGYFINNFRGNPGTRWVIIPFDQLDYSETRPKTMEILPFYMAILWAILWKSIPFTVGNPVFLYYYYCYNDIMCASARWMMIKCTLFDPLRTKPRLLSFFEYVPWSNFVPVLDNLMRDDQKINPSKTKKLLYIRVYGSHSHTKIR